MANFENLTESNYRSAYIRKTVRENKRDNINAVFFCSRSNYSDEPDYVITF